MSWRMRGAFILIASFSACHAGALDFSSSGIYRATKEACSRVHVSDLSNLNADKLRAGYFPSVEFTEILNFIRRESVNQTALNMNFGESESARYILQDKEFRRALQECYPDDERLRSFFIKSIYTADLAGKTVGVVALATVFKGTGRLAALVTGWSQKAGLVLKYADMALTSLLGSAVLRGDSPAPNEAAIKLSTSQIRERLSVEVQNQNENLKSLKKQILEEENKIRSCGQCPELDQLTANKEGLMQILRVSEASESNR